MPSRLVADALTLITLSLFGQLGQVNGVFVTHCDVWSVWIAVSRCEPDSKARQRCHQRLSQLQNSSAPSVRYRRARETEGFGGAVACFASCVGELGGAASGATPIACVAFAPDSRGRKEGRRAITGLRTERRRTPATMRA